jgi:excisionase family DNA binding protein
MDTSEMLNGLLTIGGLAKALSIGETYARLLVTTGRIKGKKLGRQWVINQREFKRYVENMNDKQKAALWKKGRKV